MKNKRTQLLDARGNPVASWDYQMLQPSRMRKMYGPRVTRPEHEMLDYHNRQALISYLRRQVRNSTVLRAICYRYALSVGAPTLHSETTDPLYNDEKEIYLERKFRRIGYGNRYSLRMLEFIVSMEELIGGEVFAVFTDSGHVQLIPSELCGSPETPPPGEVDGIGYDGTGAPRYYRFGKRVRSGGTLTKISFAPADSTLVDAEYVRHIFQPDRVECGRGVPPLVSAIADMQDLQDIVKSKVMQIKLQQAWAMFIKKNMDPALFAEMLSASGGNEQYFIDMAMGRGDYQTVQAGGIMYGEIGEEVQTINPPINSSDFDVFEKRRLYHICSVVGMPPEEAILGFGESNYSSSRADKNRWKQVVDNVRKNHEDIYLNDLQQWIMSRGASFGDVRPAPPGESMEINWTWPPLPTIDPAKDTAEHIMALESGLESKSEIVGRRGRHADTVDAQIVREAKRRAELILEAAGEDRPPTYEEITAQMPNGRHVAEAIRILLADRDRSEVDTPEN